MDLKITASISTRNRYFSTLPLCLTSIANQTKVPDELIIWDDGEHKDLREDPTYQSIFAHLTKRKIDWHVEFGSGEGQVKNHQRTIEVAKHELIYRVDDDCVLEANVLETLFGELGKNAGAIGGLVLDPKVDLHPNKMASSKIEDIFMGLNEQWFPHDKPTIKQVDHLYSSFLFRKEAATHGYEMGLSRISHREESYFTYEMKRKGWNLLVTPHCVTWHYNSPTGGIRDDSKEEMWKHDEELFKQRYKEWGIKPNIPFPIVLNCGLGDHYAFKTIMPELIEKHKGEKIFFACCFPQLFEEYANKVRIMSIADAMLMLGHNIENFDVYKFMVDNKWRGHMIDAFKSLYKI